MAELCVRLWQRELVDRLIEAGDDESDLWEWAVELAAEEKAAQSDFRAVGAVFAQLSQVEVGVRNLANGLDSTDEVGTRIKSPRFFNHINLIRSAFAPRFVKELKALDDVRHLRNYFAHGEVRVGMASLGCGAPLEPVIVLVHSEADLSKSVDEADPLREVVDGGLDVFRAMEVASEGLEALLKIMLDTGFSPYAKS